MVTHYQQAVLFYQPTCNKEIDVIMLATPRCGQIDAVSVSMHCDILHDLASDRQAG